jgi:hypothetical protein
LRNQYQAGQEAGKENEKEEELAPEKEWNEPENDGGDGGDHALSAPVAMAIRLNSMALLYHIYALLLHRCARFGMPGLVCQVWYAGVAI